MLAERPVGFIFGVGPATQEKLLQRGFRMRHGSCHFSLFFRRQALGQLLDEQIENLFRRLFHAGHQVLTATPCASIFMYSRILIRPRRIKDLTDPKGSPRRAEISD